MMHSNNRFRGYSMLSKPIASQHFANLAKITLHYLTVAHSVNRRAPVCC